MELRKNPKIDLERKRNAFFNIGLATSLMLVISAFEWRFYGDGGLVNLGEIDDDFEEIMEIPQTLQPPPPPPVVVLPKIVEVPDEEEIEEDVKSIIDVEINEDDTFEDPIFDEPLPPEIVEEVLIFVESMPEPIGGMSTFYKHVAKQMKYPNQARRMGIEGKVYVQFVIDKNGKLTEVQAIKGIGAGCDEEAVRVIKNAPDWSPGKQRGQPVKVRMILPVTFKLG
ncbi:outer membrane transport energization protein TonB (TC 2.C.1.1.1) [Reichenbachiella faecimaris]|uniref:Outer membrane transport energization protein TonB (TC 2.C.1.1.1) n=1 Tax=Reichenbachiella faecimaris TaxID=692418 RepID=A0A1W2GBJ8_REIFA|nr:energy transducer TonB [Reichenbachiella faecimaris]SMD34035.1 outer membrane transport energization protein TonB (TC 2.C.1.1.1) [Reichenbachiella faecimaris]